MRGHLQPSVRNNPTEVQQQFAKLSRHRRAHLAEAAKTNLVKASQWARGERVDDAVATALEAQVRAHGPKKR